MKTRKADTDGKPKNGLVQEHYTDGTLASVGKLRDGQKIGEWRVCSAKGRLIKTTKHKSKQEKS